MCVDAFFLPTKVHREHPQSCLLASYCYSLGTSLYAVNGVVDLPFLDLGVVLSSIGTAEITFSWGYSIVGFPKPCRV